MKKNARIYIAGHLGLVGSAIWRCLEARGYTNLIGRSVSELDLTDQYAASVFFAKEKPEYVFLAAAKVGGIVANNTYRADFIYQNLAIQNNLVHQSYLHGVKKLLFLGSTCIYPRDCPQPMKEEYLLSGPLEYTNEPYAIAKIAGIRLCESYNLQYGTNFLSVMPTNLYGPGDNFDLHSSHVLPALMRKMHLGKCLAEGRLDAVKQDLKKRPLMAPASLGSADALPVNPSDSRAVREALHDYGIRVRPSDDPLHPRVRVEVWGSGNPLREFLYSEDMADACVFVMENLDFARLAGDASPVRNTHLNIGTGREISIGDLARLIKSVVGFEGELFFNTQKPDGTPRKLTDPSRLHQLGWKHNTDIEQGIKKLYEAYLAGLA